MLISFKILPYIPVANIAHEIVNGVSQGAL